MPNLFSFFSFFSLFVKKKKEREADDESLRIMERQLGPPPPPVVAAAAAAYSRQNNSLIQIPAVGGDTKSQTISRQNWVTHERKAAPKNRAFVRICKHPMT